MSRRKSDAAAKARNKKHKEKKEKELPKCAICGFMPAKRGLENMYWCKKCAEQYNESSGH